MSNPIKNQIEASAAFTITLDALATTTLGVGAVGRQSTEISNPNPGFTKCDFFVYLVQGTSPTGNKSAVLYLLENDNDASPWRQDEAGASDAGITIINAPVIGVGINKASPATGEIITFKSRIIDPPLKFAVALAHDTGVNLGSGCYIRYQFGYKEIQ